MMIQEGGSGGTAGRGRSQPPAHLYGLVDLAQGLLSLCVGIIQSQSSPVQSLRRDQFLLFFQP